MRPNTPAAILTKKSFQSVFVIARDHSRIAMLLLFIITCLVIFLVHYFFREHFRRVILARKIPGPTAYPLIGNANLFVGIAPEGFLELFRSFAPQYGDIVRIWIGPELNVLVTDLKFVEEVLGTNKILDKAGEYDLLDSWLQEGLLVSSGQKWFKRRKIITPAFHFKILEQFIEVFDEQSRVLVTILNKFGSRDDVDMCNLVGLCALDTLCGRKWYCRRKIITPAFHFKALEKYVGIFDKESNILVSILEKATAIRDYIRMNEHIGICALDIICGRKWFTRRKIITPAFHFRILEQFVDVFDTQSTTLVKSLFKYSENEEVDIYPHITHCALDVICETAMGVSCKAQINSDSKYVQAVKTLSMVLHKRMFDVLYRYEIIFQFTNLARIQKQALKVVHDFSNSVIVARRNELLRSHQEKSFANPSDENDNNVGAKKKMAFLDILLQSQVDGKPLSNRDIQEEVDTFMFEGHDTTTSAITFALYNLAKHPDAQNKCFQEICEVIGTDKNKPISFNDLNNLNYMESVAKETLRLYPSVPLLGRKVLKECTISGKRIPAGTNIGISPLVLGRNEKVFPQAEKFIPERFDSSMVTGGDKMNPYSFIPFSAGPRNCIGQKFAMLEIKSVVSKILRHFEIEMADNNQEPILIAELILKSKNALMFRLKPRVYAK